MKKLSVILLMAMCSLPGISKTYFAGPAATGNGLSNATPGDFAKLVTLLKPRDVLFCRGGQYDLTSEVNISASGTEAAKITIQSYQEEKPVFDFRKEAYGGKGIVVANNVKYLYVKGLTIRYAGADGLSFGGSNSILENLDLYGNCGNGLLMTGTDGRNLILNCDSHENFDYKLGNINAARFGQGASGFSEEDLSAPGNYYQGCRAWRNSSDGWNFNNRTTTEGGIVVDNCISFRNSPSVYDMRYHARYSVDYDWFKQFEGKGITVTAGGGNTEEVSLEFYTNSGYGDGFRMGGDGKNCNLLITRSLASFNKRKGFGQNGNNGIMLLFNNTAYKNAYNMGFSEGEYGTAYVRNNVSFASTSKDQLACKVTNFENNSWLISGVICNASDFESVDTTKIIVPRKADYTLAPTEFLRLRSDADLIDQGVKNVGLDYYGAAPDLGYMELENGEVTKAVTDTLVTSVIGSILEVKNAKNAKPVVAKAAAGRGGTGARKPAARPAVRRK